MAVSITLTLFDDHGHIHISSLTNINDVIMISLNRKHKLIQQYKDEIVTFDHYNSFKRTAYVMALCLSVMFLWLVRLGSSWACWRQANVSPILKVPLSSSVANY